MDIHAGCAVVTSNNVDVNASLYYHKISAKLIILLLSFRETGVRVGI